MNAHFHISTKNFIHQAGERSFLTPSSSPLKKGESVFALFQKHHPTHIGMGSPAHFGIFLGSTNSHP